VIAGRRILLSWSGGKDAAWALHELRHSARSDVVGLITSVVPELERSAMHGVRLELIRLQARSAGLPLLEVPLPWPCSNAHYEAAFRSGLAGARDAWGVTHIAFGDLFLADIRAYRERLLEGSGLDPLFPLWQRPTAELLRAMLAAGLRARIVCLDPKQLDRRFAGRELDAGLAAELPPGVDPCGERGEFHTFVTEGPMLVGPIPVAPADVVERDGFVYADLLPRQADDGAVPGPEPLQEHLPSGPGSALRRVRADHQRDRHLGAARSGGASSRPCPGGGLGTARGDRRRA